MTSVTAEFGGVRLKAERFPTLAEGLVKLHVDTILAIGDLGNTVAARNASATIPIVTDKESSKTVVAPGKPTPCLPLVRRRLSRVPKRNLYSTVRRPMRLKPY